MKTPRERLISLYRDAQRAYRDECTRLATEILLDTQHTRDILLRKNCLPIDTEIYPRSLQEKEELPLFFLYAAADSIVPKIKIANAVHEIVRDALIKEKLHPCGLEDSWVHKGRVCIIDCIHHDDECRKYSHSYLDLDFTPQPLPTPSTPPYETYNTSRELLNSHIDRTLSTD